MDLSEVKKFEKSSAIFAKKFVDHVAGSGLVIPPIDSSNLETTGFTGTFTIVDFNSLPPVIDLQAMIKESLDLSFADGLRKRDRKFTEAERLAVIEVVQLIEFVPSRRSEVGFEQIVNGWHRGVDFERFLIERPDPSTFLAEPLAELMSCEVRTIHRVCAMGKVLILKGASVDVVQSRPKEEIARLFRDLPGDILNRITALNDSGKSFAEIGADIRRCLELN